MTEVGAVRNGTEPFRLKSLNSLLPSVRRPTLRDGPFEPWGGPSERLAALNHQQQVLSFHVLPRLHQ